MMTKNQLYSKLKKAKRVAIFAHQSADADCLGSLSALSFLLKKLNKYVDIFVDDTKIKRMHAFMNVADKLDNECKFDNYDTVISVDIATARMLGKYKNDFLNFENKIIIDHHANRDLHGKYEYIELRSACGEIIYDLFKHFKIKPSKQIATNLYSAIADDTGCFMHDNTTSQTHEICGNLIKIGADYVTANYNLFKLIYENTFELNKLLLNKVKRENSLSYCVITDEFLKTNKFEASDVGNFVNTLINIENTKIGILLTEKTKNTFSVSLRSIGNYDVSKVAENFGGGGHKHASGCVINGESEIITPKILEVCYNIIKETDNV